MSGRVAPSLGRSGVQVFLRRPPPRSLNDGLGRNMRNGSGSCALFSQTCLGNRWCLPPIPRPFGVQEMVSCSEAKNPYLGTSPISTRFLVEEDVWCIVFDRVSTYLTYTEEEL